MVAEHKRCDRIADLLQRELADLLLRRVKDPRVDGMTITGVKVSGDLQHARVFYCVMGSPDEAGKEIFIIHDGIKVRLLEKVQDWQKIRLADGKTGWIKVQDFLVI